MTTAPPPHDGQTVDTMPCPREAGAATIRAALLEAARPYPELRDLRVDVSGPADLRVCHGGTWGAGRFVKLTRSWPRPEEHVSEIRIDSLAALRETVEIACQDAAFAWTYRPTPSAPGCPVCAVLGSCGTCRNEAQASPDEAAGRILDALRRDPDPMVRLAAGPEIAAPASVLQGEPQGLTGAGERTPLPQGWTWDHQYPICANGPDRTFAMVRARDTHLGPAGSVYTDIRELRLKAQVLAALRTEAARLGLPWCGPEQTLGGVR